MHIIYVYNYTTIYIYYCIFINTHITTYIIFIYLWLYTIFSIPPKDAFLTVQRPEFFSTARSQRRMREALRWFSPQKMGVFHGWKPWFCKKGVLGMEWSYHFLKIYLDVFRQFEATESPKMRLSYSVELKNKEWSTIWLTDVDCICCDRFARLLGVLFPPGERPPTKSTRMG